jgi:hypothetical protein
MGALDDVLALFTSKTTDFHVLFATYAFGSRTKCHTKFAHLISIEP